MILLRQNFLQEEYMKKFITVAAMVILAVVLATMLMACTPSADSLKKKYEDKGYKVEVLEGKDLDDIMGGASEYGELEYMLRAENEDGDYVSIVCFKNSEDAKKAYDEAKKQLDEMKEEFGDELPDEFDMDIKKRGNAFASGTKAAVAIF